MNPLPTRRSFFSSVGLGCTAALATRLVRAEGTSSGASTSASTATATTATTASVEALEHALVDVARARAAIHTLHAPFVQVRTVSLLATKVRSTGHMWLVRPDRLRWELDAPDAAVYWVLPDGLAYRTSAGAGVVPRGARGPLGGVLGDLLVLLGGDLTTLRARYELLLIARDAHGLVLHAVPRDPAMARSMQRIELEFQPDLATMQRVVLVERGKDRSEITFGAFQRDAVVDPKLLTGA